MSRSTSGAPTRVSDLVTGDESSRRDLDFHDGGSVSVKGGELRVKPLAVLVDVNHPADIAGHEVGDGHGGRQHDPIELSNHRFNAYNESSCGSRESRSLLAK